MFRYQLCLRLPGIFPAVDVLPVTTREGHIRGPVPCDTRERDVNDDSALLHVKSRVGVNVRDPSLGDR